jgi:hypothetical protein
MGIQMDFATNEPMRPVRVNVKDPAEESDGPCVGGPSQKDDQALRRSLPIELPVGGHGRSRRRSANAHLGALTGGRDVSMGAVDQIGNVRVPESTPHFALPPAVEALQRGLECRFAGGSKDGHDAEGQKRSGQAPPTRRAC